MRASPYGQPPSASPRVTPALTARKFSEIVDWRIVTVMALDRITPPFPVFIPWFVGFTFANVLLVFWIAHKMRHRPRTPVAWSVAVSGGIITLFALMLLAAADSSSQHPLAGVFTTFALLIVGLVLLFLGTGLILHARSQAAKPTAVG